MNTQPPPAMTPGSVNQLIEQVIRNPQVARLVSEIQKTIRWQKQAAHPNPLTRSGRKFFSQNDEDGILLEILRRMCGDGAAMGCKTFIEFGVGNGLENNTLILLMQGWRGFWAGGEDLVIDVKGQGKLGFEKGWINQETALRYYLRGCMHLGTDQIDVFSIDLDGTDLYVLKAILAQGHRPSVVVCEYNGKFPPPIEFAVAYDPKFSWNGSDHYGASLQAYVSLLAAHDYQLMACNITGANAFFVQKKYADKFPDVPTSIDQIFVAADYGFVTGLGHPGSCETINRFL